MMNPATDQNPPGQRKKVAVIDDDPRSARNLEIELSFIGEQPLPLPSADWQERLAASEARAQVLALLVGTLPEGGARDILLRLRELGWQLPVLLIGDPAPSNELDAELRAAVLAVIERPVQPRALLDPLAQARRQLGLPSPAFKSALISASGTAMFRSLVGNSPVLQRVREQIREVGTRDEPVLVLGETGTGKEIVARHLHYVSARPGPFVAVNSATLQAVAGAGSGDAVASLPKLLEGARDGTLFLGRIDTLPALQQRQLLDFLQQQDEAAGGAGARIVAATAVSLQRHAAAGDFLEPLYQRLALQPLELPPLRERSEDIPDLLNELLSRLEREGGATLCFSSLACLSLQRHPWPGNLRELVHLVERLGGICPGAVIGLDDLPASYQHLRADEVEQLESRHAAERGRVAEAPDGAAVAEAARAPAYLDRMNAERLKRCLAGWERDLLATALARCGGNLKRTAEHLRTSPAQLEQRLRKHGLQV